MIAVTPERLAEAIAWMTPKRFATLDALTLADIAAAVVADLDGVHVLNTASFARARLIMPLKGAK